MTYVWVATATSDWGAIFYDRKIEASTFGAAIAKAGRAAHAECRRRPRQISVRVTRVAKKV